MAREREAAQDDERDGGAHAVPLEARIDERQADQAHGGGVHLHQKIVEPLRRESLRRPPNKRGEAHRDRRRAEKGARERRARVEPARQDVRPGGAVSVARMSVHRVAHKAGSALALLLHQRLRGERPEALPRVGAEEAVKQRKNEIRQHESHEHRAHGCRSEDAERPCRCVARSRLLDCDEQQRHDEEPLANDERRHEASASAVPERRLGGDGGADGGEHEFGVNVRGVNDKERRLWLNPETSGPYGLPT